MGKAKTDRTDEQESYRLQMRRAIEIYIASERRRRDKIKAEGVNNGGVNNGQA